MIANLIYYFLTNKENKCDFMYMFSQTAYLRTETNSQYNSIDKKALIPATDQNIKDVVTGLIASQKKTNYKFKILLVFDDIDIKNNPVFDDLATRGRHYGFTVIFSCQVANTAVSPKIRKNTSYLFWRGLNATDTKDNVYPIVGVAFENAQQVVEFTDENTKDYKFAFFDNDQDFNSESIQLVKAEPVPESFKYVVKTDEPKKNGPIKTVKNGPRNTSVWKSNDYVSGDLPSLMRPRIHF
jgi:hypothetical protein